MEHEGSGDWLDEPVTDWLDGLGERASALLIEGPPGIGKTHQLTQVLAAATPAGVRVLAARPAAVEHRLVGSAMIDLCAGVGDDEIEQLPDVQAAALFAALLRRSPAVAPDPHAVALGFTTLLARLVATERLLIAIDDVQWLDRQTADVLAFALRRAPAAGLGVLFALRTEPGVPDPDLVTGLAAALPLRRHVVQPHTDPGIERILRAQLARDVPRRVVRAAVHNAGGNPLFALEIARTLASRPVEHGGPEEAPVPTSLFDLVGRHVAELPDATRHALAVAAAMRRPRLAQLIALGVAADLPPAERAGIVRVREREVEFEHPLYAAAAYQALSGSERMLVHSRVAAVVEGDEERARHLALGVDEPDESVASALDLARIRALERAALDAALQASRLAVTATPPGASTLAGRRVEFAGLLFRSGDVDGARRELDAALGEAPDRLVRARVLYTLAQVLNDSEGPFAATPVYLEALELIGDDDPRLAADIRMGLAINYADDWQTALEHAEVARELIGSLPEPDPARAAKALVAEAGARFYLGLGADLETCREAVRLQAGDVALPVSDRAISVLFYLQLWIDDFAGARASMDEAYKLALDEGDEASRCYVLANRARLEVRSGDWPEAERLIDECTALAEMSANPVFGAMMAGERAWLAAYRGEFDPALRIAEGDVERGAATGNRLAEQRGRGLRGWCALAAGDAERAAVDLDRYMELFESNNAGEPALRQLAGDHVEALVLSGRLADAEYALARLREPAERLGRTALLAAAARAEAVLRTEQGDADAALAAAARSRELYDRVERRFERARALLVSGQVHRRFRQRAAARAVLSEALEEFEALGAHGFASRARVELARIGGGPSVSAGAVGLSEIERQIALHAASGLRSAEIGRLVFLSPKTVSAHLTRIYQKLGVRNRAELAARLPQLAPGEAAPG